MTRDFIAEAADEAAAGDEDGVARNRLCGIEHDEEVDAEEDAMRVRKAFVAMTRFRSCFIVVVSGRRQML